MKRTSLLATAVVFLGQQSLALAATILVPEDQPTIRSCVSAAAPGDTCSVAAGVYYELPPEPAPVGGVVANVILNKPVVIRSRELYQAVLDGADQSTAFFVAKANVHPTFRTFVKPGARIIPPPG